jgi:hypothetical protein
MHARADSSLGAEDKPSVAFDQFGTYVAAVQVRFDSRPGLGRLRRCSRSDGACRACFKTSASRTRLLHPQDSGYVLLSRCRCRRLISTSGFRLRLREIQASEFTERLASSDVVRPGGRDFRIE